MARIIIIGLTFLAACGLTQAQDYDGYMAAYRAHLAAMEAGDGEKAHEAGEAAWRLAEEAGAPEAQLEALAWNYAQVAFDLGRYENAVEAYERSIELAEDDPEADFESVLERRIFLASAQRFAGDDRKARKTLKKVKKAIDDEAVSPLIAGRYWVEYAASEAADKSGYAEVAALAARAEEALTQAGAVDGVYGARAALFQGYSPESRGEWDEAVRHYQNAFDRLETMANDAPLKAVVTGRLSYAQSRLEQFEDLRRRADADGAGNAGNVVAGGLVIVDRQPPDYPYRAADRGISGYAFAQYDVMENGAVANVEVVDSWPQDVFDDAVLNAVREWRYEPPRDENGAPVVVEDRIVMFPFLMEPQAPPSGSRIKRRG